MPDRWGGIQQAVDRGYLIAFERGQIDLVRDVVDKTPSIWSDWASRFGALRSLDGTKMLLGCTAEGALSRNAASTTLQLRRLYRRLPTHLLAIELLPDRQAAFVDTRDEKGAVVLVDLDEPDRDDVVVAPTLVDFVYEWHADLRAIKRIRDHIDNEHAQVNAGKRQADRLERPKEWTATRLCSEDVVLAMLRGRHSRTSNAYEVSAFSAATLTSFAPGATVRAALCALLCDAYRGGGSLAVSFGSGKAQYPVPGPLRRWAADRGVELPVRGGWDAATGEQLFVHAANLTTGTRDLITSSGVSASAICFAVASGMWPPAAVEAILRWSRRPDRILTGALAVTDRLAWIADQYVIRAALTVAAVVNRLGRVGQPFSSPDDDTTAPVDISFGEPPTGLDPTLSPVTFTLPHGFSADLQWPVLAGNPRICNEICAHLVFVETDLIPAHLDALANRASPRRAVIVAADANGDDSPELARALAAAETAGHVVLASPDYTTSLDRAAAQTLQRLRTARL